MSLFAWIFGRKSAKPLLSEILDKFSSDLEPVLQRHFLDYQKKIGLLSRFESSQVKSRDFKKKLKKLFSLPARGQIGSFEKKEIAGILSLLSSAVDKEQNPDIKDLEKEEQILLAAFSEQIDRLAGNLEAQHSWIAEHLSDVESYEDVVGLKELLIKEGRILYEIEKKELPRIHSELDLILSRTSYPEGSSMADKMLKEKLRRKKWLESEAKKGFVTLYHAYPKKYAPSPLLTGGVLDKKIYPGNFYMAERDDEAIDAVSYQKMGKYTEQDFNVLVVQIQVDVFDKICVPTGSEVAWGTYFIIPVENYDSANKAIKRGLLKFSKF